MIVMTSLEDLAVIVGPRDSIDHTIRAMAARSKQVVHSGIAVVLDQTGVVQGIVTDGDLRRAYAADISLQEPVTLAMVADPISVPSDLTDDAIITTVYRKVRENERLTSQAVRHVLVTDDQNRLVNIHDFLELLAAADHRSSSVAIYGMGYVGLTLAAALANRAHDVTGIDLSPSIVEHLSAGESHILEPGLEDLIRTNLERGSIRFQVETGTRRPDVYIVAVGTPIGDVGIPDLGALEAVADEIGRVLKSGDMVMLRSTVPVGTTRRRFTPLLEQKSGLTAGQDFHIAFAPERTVEGNALHELRVLPQIVCGLTPQCTRRAADFWATLTPSVVRVASIEAAEMVKLANNCFRDISFAFANELALAADSVNLDAFELIQAANEGYPRNPIPLPSPGVGGYCLTKDPIIFAHSFNGAGFNPHLSRVGRQVNEAAGRYPLDMVYRYAKRRETPATDLSVLLVGIAFKGSPETTDMRGSVSLDIADQLRTAGISFRTWDALVPTERQQAAGLEPVDNLVEAALEADCILILNNHRLNTPDGLLSAIGHLEKLIFDGWSLFDRHEVERIPGLVYASMGYMSPAKPAS